MVTKICSKCGELKKINDFEKRSDSKDGYRRYCRLCKKIQTDRAIQKWIEKNQPQYWSMRSKSLNSSGSRRKGLAGQIIKLSEPLKAEDLKELYEKSPCCFYCQVQLNKEQVVFDHKIPLSRNGLHHITNISVTCQDCNQLKGKKTDDEFRQFLQQYLKRFTC
ncbi:MAG: HNH endonuclease [Hydrococcus sp. Prado102]|jgi:5-methylcytosine-specific restriction endonuclease McrA|nr:HNH endonuclease [Hydrococcus sp. Prado102]